MLQLTKKDSKRRTLLLDRNMKEVGGRGGGGGVGRIEYDTVKFDEHSLSFED